MLFLLTGDIQTGKTRWLQALLKELEKRGNSYAGVIAPGVWKKYETEELEKLGIDNILLPQEEKISFARRRDLAQAEGNFDETSQSAREKMMWEISEAALAQVNDYFGTLLKKHCEALDAQALPRNNTSALKKACTCATTTTTKAAKAATAKTNCSSEKNSSEKVCSPSKNAADIAAPSLLIIDELGRLELLRNAGLTNATNLIKQGPSTLFPHAVIIVRESLLPDAHALFDSAWNGKVEEIFPNDPCRQKILNILYECD